MIEECVVPFYSTVIYSETEDILCECRMPSDGTSTVKCGMCQKLYHTTCVSIHDARMDNENKRWLCTKCKMLF